MSNLKQISLASAMYVQDYDEKYPRYIYNIAYAKVTRSNPFGWASSLYPYIKNDQIFQCPSEESAGPKPSLSAKDLYSNSKYSDYWFNYNASGQALAAFDAPTLSVLFGDGESFDSDKDTAQTDAFVQSNKTGGKASYALYGNAKGIGNYAAFLGASRHLDGANIAFADGHVKWEKGAGGDHPDYSQSVYVKSIGTDSGAPTFSIKASG